jgi:signal transduction histidine kinase
MPAMRFFEDRHIDSQMRALIPRFTRYAVLLTILSAPLTAPTVARGFVLVGNALVALAIVEAMTRTGVLDRAREVHIFGLLAFFVVQVAFGSAVSAHLVAYGVLQALPIVFAAAFFDRPVARYSLPFVAALAEYLAVLSYGDPGVEVFLVRVLCMLLAAHFGTALAGILREALRTHVSLHSVLEAATEGTDEQTLVERGLDAALSVVRWDAGAVALTDAAGGDAVSITAMRGFADAVVRHYTEEPLRRGDGGFASEILTTGRQAEVTDVAALFPEGHPLRAAGVVAMAGTPIPYQGIPIGVLLTFHCTPRTLDARERDRLSGVAEQLGLALGSARAHRREAEVTASLRDLNRRKDAFLAAVSHELRTPATTIELASRTLERAGDRLSHPELVKVRSALVSRSRDLRELIEALLDVALTESGESRLLIEPVQWVAATRRWVAELEERLGRPIALDLPETEFESYADPAKIERVLFALVSNAVKFSFDGTPVTVSLRRGADTLTFAVTDEGMGILPGDVERIFDRFLQLDDSSTRQVGGLGIGLTLVRHFIGLHGGRVDVTSEVGEGSTFTVTLPLRQASRHD